MVPFGSSAPLPTRTLPDPYPAVAEAAVWALCGLAAAVLAVLMFAMPASAGWKMDRARAVAVKAWPGACTGTEDPLSGAPVKRQALQIQFVDDRIDPDFESANEGVGAWAFEGQCVAYLSQNRRWDFEPMCTAVIHELGHVIGWRDHRTGEEHASNPASVMAASRLFVKGVTINANTGKRTTRWAGTDRRCRNRGRDYLDGSYNPYWYEDGDPDGRLDVPYL